MWNSIFMSVLSVGELCFATISTQIHTQMYSWILYVVLYAMFEDNYSRTLETTVICVDFWEQTPAPTVLVCQHAWGRVGVIHREWKAIYFCWLIFYKSMTFKVECMYFISLCKINLVYVILPSLSPNLYNSKNLHICKCWLLADKSFSISIFHQ